MDEDALVNRQLYTELMEEKEKVNKLQDAYRDAVVVAAEIEVAQHEKMYTYCSLSFVFGMAIAAVFYILIF